MELLIAAISAGLGGVLTILVKFIIDFRKEKHNESLSVNQQAVLIYQSLVDSLKKDLALIEADMSNFQKERIDYRESLAALKVENKYLVSEIQELRLEIDSLRKQIEAYKKGQNP